MPERCDFELKRRSRPKNPSDERREKMKPSNHIGMLPVSRKASRKSDGTGFRDPQGMPSNAKLLSFSDRQREP